MAANKQFGVARSPSMQVREATNKLVADCRLRSCIAAA